MKKIIVFYGSYGNGHMTAAKSIADYLSKNKNVEVKLIDCIEYVSKFISRVSTQAYGDWTKSTPKVWKFFYGASNHKLLADLVLFANSLFANRLNKLIDKIDPDLIISTHPFSSQMCASLKKKGKINCKLATTITDFHIHQQWVSLPEYIDYFFVGNQCTKDEMLEINIPEEKIHVTGIPISDNYNQDFNKAKIYDEFNLDSNKFTILFFCNGEFGNKKENPYALLQEIITTYPDMQMVVLSGKYKKIYDKVNHVIQETNSNDRVKVIEFSSQVAELMHISNVVITKAGGLTISESLASNLPIIIINPIPGQEEENAELLIKSGCAIAGKNNEEVIKELNEFSEDPKKAKEMKEKIEAFAKPHATKDICEFLLDNLN